MSKNFEIRREVVLNATPEDVFAAVTSGTGGWMFPSELDPGVGSEGPDDPAVVAWEPPQKFAVRQEGPDGWFNALEYLIEARDGGTAALRYVHSGIFTDDWDAQYDGADKHTTFYLHSLGQYVQYFPGGVATYITTGGPEASAGPDAMATLRGALGLTDASAAGDTVSVDIPGFGTVDGVVDYLTPHFIGIRTADALYRFYGRNAFGGTVDAAHHLFAAGADQEKSQDAWKSWLDNVFA
ncbi:SRPBCC domain-containing protein [Rhodococcus sp. NPDC127530]|uniref:SRPBCC family protein n=1 Tax=unclassified Rhodococcus (in: high G+C Gram-positive bacteria) TaxID=192944 RepID=UPI0036458289